jgi:rRNA maturation endonuclease Nob1
MNRCPNGCGNTHSAFGKFCTKCGAPLIVAPVPKCECGAIFFDSYAFCNGCGRQLKALAKAAVLGRKPEARQ